MYGYERGRKDLGVDYHELHVRLYAIECKNKRGILESREQTMTVQGK